MQTEEVKFEYFFIPENGSFEKKKYIEQLDIPVIEEYIEGEIEIAKCNNGYVIYNANAKEKGKNRNATISWLMEIDFYGNVIYTKYIE